MAKFITKGRGAGRRVIPIKDLARPVGKVKVYPANIKDWYIYGGTDKGGREIVYVVKKDDMSSAVDKADSMHLEKFGTPRHFGWSFEDPQQHFEKPLHYIHIKKSYVPKPRQPDFIDRLMAYESGELTPEQDRSFLKEVKKRGLAGQLQGHYGRAIANMK